MIWERVILDGIGVGLVFNVAVALLWMLVPNAFSKMMPPEHMIAWPLIMCPLAGLICTETGSLI